jgi:hypothetical protein
MIDDCRSGKPLQNEVVQRAVPGIVESQEDFTRRGAVGGHAGAHRCVQANRTGAWLDLDEDHLQALP